MYNGIAQVGKPAAGPSPLQAPLAESLNVQHLRGAGTKGSIGAGPVRRPGPDRSTKYIIFFRPNPNSSNTSLKI